MIFIYLKMGNTVFLIAGILPIFIYSLTVFKLKKGDAIEGVYCLLLNGIWTVCSPLLEGLDTDKKVKQKAETGEHHEPKTNKRKHQNHRHQ